MKRFALTLILVAACGGEPETPITVATGALLPNPTCNNNGICAAPETITNCPHDCTPTCNFNGFCTTNETHASCPSDCPCDFSFTCNVGETAHSCPSDCPGPCPWQDMCTTHPGPMRSWCAKEISDVCLIDHYCCNTSWDATCVQEISIIARRNTCGRGMCPTVYFDRITPLPAGCGTTPDFVCNVLADTYCCTTAWDIACVAEAKTEPTYGVNPPVQPACGDFVCSTGETPNNCAIDCYR